MATLSPEQTRLRELRRYLGLSDMPDEDLATVYPDISQRFDDARIVFRALAEGAVWECPDHPGVYLAHGVACQCGKMQG